MCFSQQVLERNTTAEPTYSKVKETKPRLRKIQNSILNFYRFMFCADLLQDAVHGLRSTDVKADEHCVGVGVGQWPHVVVVGRA